MNKTILEGLIVVPEEDLSSVLDELPNQIHLTRNEIGCILFDVIQDPLIPNRFTVYEVFSSHEAFDLHQQRVKLPTWGEVAKNVERHYKLYELE
ncbi:MAG: antibiotic biosynthesis monooxygenase [Pseudomonadales bacterium]|nr:antibiotic biosynthesis monooxygenase [Pseudomonadales bacterium]